jgi:hypothetical protein
MAGAEQVYEDALRLPREKRADLADRLIESLGEDIPPEIAKAHLEEIHRRMSQVESGEVSLVPGDKALAKVRRLLSERSDSGSM